MMKLLIKIIFMSMIFGCASTSSPSLIEEVKYETDVLKAVFEYQFQNNSSSKGRKIYGYCLELEGAILDSNFIAQFSNDSTRVFSESSCPKDKETLVFYVSKVRSITKSKKYVYGGYVEGNVSSSENRYTLVKNRAGVWSVKSKKLLSIS